MKGLPFTGTAKHGEETFEITGEFKLEEDYFQFDKNTTMLVSKQYLVWLNDLLPDKLLTGNAVLECHLKGEYQDIRREIKGKFRVFASDHLGSDGEVEDIE